MITPNTKLKMSRKAPRPAESKSRFEAGQPSMPGGANPDGSLHVSCGPGAAGYRPPEAAKGEAGSGLVAACRKALSTAPPKPPTPT